jgi:nucleoside-diphosphate-sugar epimerase
MTESTQRLAVVLGAGPVGRGIAERLRRGERAVRVVTRSGRADVPDGVEVVAADVSRREEALRACEGAGVVYACVGLDYTNWAERWPPVFEGMLAGAEAAGARFVFMDNLYMYGPVDQPMREDMPLTDYGRKPAVRSRLTRTWQEAHEAGRVLAASVRASDFYGPGVTKAALGERVFGRIVQGKAAQIVGNPDQPHSFAYIGDVVRALVTVGEADDDAFGQAWNVPNAPDRTVREVVTMFGDAVGQKAKLQVAPALLLSGMALFDANMRELKEMLYQWQRPFQVDASKFEARFWGDPTTFEDGIAATADWYRGRGPA